MDRFPARALAAVCDSLRSMRQGRLGADPENLTEIGLLLDIAGVSDRGAIRQWISALEARAEARAARERSSSVRRSSQRLRTRVQLRVVEGRSRSSPR